MKYTDEKQFAAANIFGKGQPNDAYARYFAGHSFLNPLTKAGECPIAMSNVTFEPGCRNNWHIHHAPQRRRADAYLHRGVRAGIRKRARRRRASRLARWSISPPASSTWHGAKKDSWFAHIAFDVPGEDASNEWLEPVTDEEYNRL